MSTEAGQAQGSVSIEGFYAFETLRARTVQTTVPEPAMIDRDFAAPGNQLCGAHVLLVNK